MGASIVAHCDPAPVLEATEGIFDPVALPVEIAIVGKLNFAVSARRDAGLDAAIGKLRPEMVAVVASVSEKFLGRRKHRQKEARALVVVGLSLGEQQHHQSAMPIADGMELGIQPALGSTDTTRAPFCIRLAAVR